MITNIRNILQVLGKHEHKVSFVIPPVFENIIFVAAIEAWQKSIDNADPLEAVDHHAQQFKIPL